MKFFSITFLDTPQSSHNNIAPQSCHECLKTKRTRMKLTGIETA